ncbi:hypothetical protein [Propionibacterium freudenreichii]|uniref:hypothetical protein n=1 Tax=Propionibacterium freudenreichii TaxID=1744 RepID=UPI00254AD61D|nr:hypothetical protein [Propionibacterium freudenreichii]MDK9341370.1 hypothetical protein [Propionibacterium freudenreichii]
MIQTEIDRLATAIHALRPDWPMTALRTFISVNLTGYAYQDAAVAMAHVACDPATKTPARVLASGPWWQATRPGTAHITDLPPRFVAEPGPKRDPAFRRELIDQFKQDLHRPEETK